MQRRLYSLLLYGAVPFAVARLWWRQWRAPDPPDSLAQRLARRLPVRTDAPLWLHAASVGELRALAALLQQRPQAADDAVLITTGTATGCALARRMFGAAGHAVQLAPWDLPGAVSRFVAATRPRALLLVESELWPNLLAAAARQGVPVALLSARLSARSLARYRRLAPAMMRQAVQAIDVIGCQSETDRTRFIELGAAPARVHVTGNLKFDLRVDADLAVRGAQLRARWAPHRPLWVAGSTHAGEEAVLLDAQRRLMDAARDHALASPLLVMAPRHPERFAAVARWLDTQRVAFACTRGGVPGAGTPAVDVLLVDEMGVL